MSGAFNLTRNGPIFNLECVWESPAFTSCGQEFVWAAVMQPATNLATPGYWYVALVRTSDFTAFNVFAVAAANDCTLPVDVPLFSNSGALCYGCTTPAPTPCQCNPADTLTLLAVGASGGGSPNCAPVVGASCLLFKQSDVLWSNLVVVNGGININGNFFDVIFSCENGLWQLRMSDGEDSTIPGETGFVPVITCDPPTFIVDLRGRSGTGCNGTITWRIV